MTTAMMMYLCRPNFVLSPPDCHGFPRRMTMYSSPPPRWPLDPWHGTRACPGSAPGRRTTDEASQRWPTARTTPLKCEASTQCSWRAPNPVRWRIIGLLASTQTLPKGEQTAPAIAGRDPPLASSWKPTSTRHRSCHRRHTLRPRPRNRVPRGRPDWQIATWPWPRTQVERTVHGRRDHRFRFHVLWSSTHTRRPGRKTASPGIFINSATARSLSGFRPTSRTSIPWSMAKCVSPL